MSSPVLQCVTCFNQFHAQFRWFYFLSTDIFKFDADFLENEDKYKEIKRGWLTDGGIFLCLVLMFS